MKVVVASPAMKIRMRDEIFQERNVGLHAAHAEFAQRPVHAMRPLRRRSLPDVGEFHQQRIEVGRDDRAAESRAAVESHAKPAGER